MNMKLKFLGVALVALLLGGCLVQSIHPLFTEKDFIPAPRLVGAWTQQDEDGKVQGGWEFETKGPTYKLTHTDDKGRTATFQVAAGQIGTNVFLDFFPDDPSPANQLNDLAAVHLIPAHIFVKLVETRDHLMLVGMDLDWLTKYLGQNPQAVAHVFSDKVPILTASTAELKKFIARHAHDEKAFHNEIKLGPKNRGK